MTAAWWSAIAATFSAVSAVIVMRIQRRNYLESVRPELVISAWSAHNDSHGATGPSIFRLEVIRNVGRGPAFQVCAFDVTGKKGRSLGGLAFADEMVPVLASGESHATKWEIYLDWRRANTFNETMQTMGVEMELVCWDREPSRHRTKYSFFLQRQRLEGRDDQWTPIDVRLGFRTTTSEKVWWLKFTRTPKWLQSLRAKLSKRKREGAPRVT